MFGAVQKQFGTLDILVCNARPETPEFFQGPMDLTLKQWDAASDSQGKAFLIAARQVESYIQDNVTVTVEPYKVALLSSSGNNYVFFGGNALLISGL